MFLLVVVVVALGYNGSPRKAAASWGCSHRLSTVRLVGRAGHLNRWLVSCGERLQSGQLSGTRSSSRWRKEFSLTDHPERSWDRVHLVALGSRLSLSLTSGGTFPSTRFTACFEWACWTASVWRLFTPALYVALSMGLDVRCWTSGAKSQSDLRMDLTGGSALKMSLLGWLSWWQASTACLAIMKLWVLTGRILVSRCRWLSSVMRWHPVAIRRAVFCLVCRESRWVLHSWLEVCI